MPVTHTATRTVVLNGTTEYPTAVTPIDISGVPMEAEDGTPTAVWLSNKRRWSLRWDSPLPVIVSRLRFLYAARANISFIDPWGASYTVMIPPGGLLYVIQHGAAGDTGLTVYPLDLDVWEV